MKENIKKFNFKYYKLFTIIIILLKKSNILLLLSSK